MTDEDAEKLTTRYNREARDYQQLWAPVLRTAELRLLDEFTGLKPDRVLDVAAGVGILLPDLHSRFPKAFVAGLDRSAGMLGLAPSDAPRAVMDARELAIASDAIDLVLMAFVLFHLNNPLEGLLEGRRVLRKGGRIGTLTWNGDMESLAQTIWNDCLEAHGAPPPDPNAQLRQSVVDSPDKMEALLDAAGFSEKRAWVGDLGATFDIESLFARWTRMGAGKARFDALEPAAQADCLRKARLRLSAIPPQGFEARAKVVYAVATA